MEIHHKDFHPVAPTRSLNIYNTTFSSSSWIIAYRSSFFFMPIISYAFMDSVKTISPWISSWISLRTKHLFPSSFLHSCLFGAQKNIPIIYFYSCQMNSATWPEYWTSTHTKHTSWEGTKSLWSATWKHFWAEHLDIVTQNFESKFLV